MMMLTCKVCSEYKAKQLFQHLRSVHNMTVQRYRELYGADEIVQVGFNPKTSTYYKVISNERISNNVKGTYIAIRQLLESIDVYELEQTKSLLLQDNKYLKYIGKTKHRTLISEDIKLYKSILYYTNNLDDKFKKISFPKRIEYILSNFDDNVIMCICRQKYTFNNYCNKCPDRPGSRTSKNKKLSEETRKKIRISTLNYISKMNSCRIIPRYNINSISIIESYGKEHGYHFIHAENGGEYHIKELGYFLDAYDPVNNVVLEIDEHHHYDSDGNLRDRDVIRQKEIENLLNCKFIRIRV